MSTKPTIANARWADVGGTPSAGTSAPSSGKRDTGWAVEKPTYQNMNYLLRQFYLWCQYVSDQVFTGNVEVASGGHFKVSGAGRYTHGDMQHIVPGAAFRSVNTNGIYDASGRPGLTSSSSTVFFATVVLPAGARIRSIDWVVTRGGSGTISCALIQTTDGGSTATVNTTSISTGSGTTTTASGTLNTDVATNTAFTLKVTMDNNVQTFDMAVIKYDFPTV